ncbi:MAG: hypothetical protein JRN20_21260 [Nitrososphaerota archaeon]|nr:hypothetical protein [Nitrososphaerota archaeon]
MRSAISTIAVAILVAIVVIAGVASVYLLGFRDVGGNVSHSVSTITQTSTFPCPTSIENQTTSQNGTTVNSLPSFGPLFGNFSAMTVELYGNGSTGNSVTTSSFSVLNRSTYTSSSGTATAYEVNITTVAIEPNVEVEGFQNYTTTLVSPGNHTNRESVVAYFSSNGSKISTVGIGRNSTASYAGIGYLTYFYPIVTQNYSKSALSVINKTTISIGSTKMDITNYEHPALMIISVQEGCNGEPPITNRATIYDWAVQEGVARGKSFSLLTQYHQIYSVNSNPTSSTSSEFSLNWRVTSFTVS